MQSEGAVAMVLLRLLDTFLQSADMVGIHSRCES